MLCHLPNAALVAARRGRPNDLDGPAKPLGRSLVRLERRPARVIAPRAKTHQRALRLIPSLSHCLLEPMGIWWVVWSSD